MEANDGRQAQGAYIPQELLKEISKVNTVCSSVFLVNNARRKNVCR